MKGAAMHNVSGHILLSFCCCLLLLRWVEAPWLLNAAAPSWSGQACSWTGSTPLVPPLLICQGHYLVKLIPVLLLHRDCS
jgi:hypothetical protein